jgi:hypothetical protein
MRNLPLCARNWLRSVLRVLAGSQHLINLRHVPIKIKAVPVPVRAEDPVEQAVEQRLARREKGRQPLQCWHIERAAALAATGNSRIDQIAGPRIARAIIPYSDFTACTWSAVKQLDVSPPVHCRLAGSQLHRRGSVRNGSDSRPPLWTAQAPRTAFVTSWALSAGSSACGDDASHSSSTERRYGRACDFRRGRRRQCRHSRREKQHLVKASSICR